MCIFSQSSISNGNKMLNEIKFNATFNWRDVAMWSVALLTRSYVASPFSKKIKWILKTVENAIYVPFVIGARRSSSLL